MDIDNFRTMDIDNSEIPENLVEAEFAYHVTNISAQCQKPDFDELKYTIAADALYDGILVNLPCVFFTTTKYRGGLTTTSPYPTLAKQGSLHWRVKVPLNEFKDFDMYYCDNLLSPSQVHLILIKEEDEKQYIENIPGISKLDKEDNKWLCYRKEKWYTNDYNNNKTKYFVNLVVLHNFPLSPCSSSCVNQCPHWDTIKRSTVGFGQLLDKRESALGLLKQWSAALKSKELQQKHDDLLIKSEEIQQKFDKLKQKYSTILQRMSQIITENGINIPDIGFCMFLESMKIYHNLFELSAENLESIKQAAKERIILTRENVVTYANLASKHQLSDLREWCCSYMSTYRENTRSCDGIDNIELLNSADTSKVLADILGGRKRRRHG